MNDAGDGARPRSFEGIRPPSNASGRPFVGLLPAVPGHGQRRVLPAEKDGWHLEACWKNSVLFSILPHVDDVTVPCALNSWTLPLAMHGTAEQALGSPGLLSGLTSELRRLRRRALGERTINGITEQCSALASSHCACARRLRPISTAVSPVCSAPCWLPPTKRNQPLDHS
jgi:hypothetical protein